MRALTMDEVLFVSGGEWEGFLPRDFFNEHQLAAPAMIVVARVVGMAVFGGAVAALNEHNGDGLTWSDAEKVAHGAIVGAVGGRAAAWYKNRGL
jgi:hypothetical protein